MRVNKDEYWDLYVNKDQFGRYVKSTNKLYDACLLSYIDAEDPDCISGTTVYSKEEYHWDSALTTSAYTLHNIGYTGVDNGLFTFRRDRISNKDFFDIYAKSEFDMPEDGRLILRPVSGNTQLYEYPMTIEDGEMKFNGGFLQGFFKTECDKYYILPSVLQNDDIWEFEFEIKRCDYEKESDKTLNDKYPNNKGIFFYIGTRAENKWIYLYDKEDVEGKEECEILSHDDYIEDGHIDKKDYIIGNFYDLDPEFEEDPPIDIDDYLNFNYYDESLYTPSEEELFSDEIACDGESLMDDYLYMPSKPRVIDENLPHETMDWCCDFEPSEPTKTATTVVWYNACGCLKRKIVKKNVEPDTKLAGCDLFGEDGYIDDFDGLDYDVDYFEPEMNISDFEYETYDGFKFNSAKDYFFYTDNKFLLFDRTKTGFKTNNWVEGTKMMYYGKRDKFKGNLFILMNRTRTGYTVNDIDKLRDEANNKYDDLYTDIYNNAFALRITDDGEVGYRYLVKDCEADNYGKYSIEEGYSFKNVIKDCEYQTIHVRMKTSFDKMKLMFYVDGKLVYITKWLPKLNLHALNDLYEKQEGVPFNISLGGGTQGLAETILSNYMMNPTRLYPLEENFAGTFIGAIKSFKFYNCKLPYYNIVGNYNFEKLRLI